LYNPYQFSHACVRQDFKNWASFFLHNGSVRWEKWLEKGMSGATGLRSTVTEVLGWMLYILPVYVQLTVKLHAFNVLFGGVDVALYDWTLALGTQNYSLLMFFAASPAFSSMIFSCVLIQIVTCISRRRPSNLVCMVISSISFCVELLISTHAFLHISWWFCIVNVFVYKLFTYELLAFLVQCWMQFRGHAMSEQTGCLTQWFKGVRLQRDIAVSMLILVPLFLVSLLNFLRVLIQAGDHAPLHNLFVFRAWGDYRRQTNSVHDAQLQSMSRRSLLP